MWQTKENKSARNNKLMKVEDKNKEVDINEVAITLEVDRVHSGTLLCSEIRNKKEE